MSAEQQPGEPAPPAISYEQQFEELAQAHRAHGDPSVFVFENYLKWKGVPHGGTRLAEPQAHLSPHFSVLEYPGGEGFRVYCTLGASYTVIPGSPQSFDDRRGVRYEYLMHAAPQHGDLVSELLLLISAFPFEQQVEIQPGFVLPNGEPVAPGSGMEYLFFTYPYLDDAKIYSGQPWGQIERGKLLIQMLWVYPIYLSEVRFLQQHGPDAFEERVNARHAQQYDAFDFMRLPYV